MKIRDQMCPGQNLFSDCHIIFFFSFPFPLPSCNDTLDVLLYLLHLLQRFVRQISIFHFKRCPTSTFTNYIFIEFFEAFYCFTTY